VTSATIRTWTYGDTAFGVFAPISGESQFFTCDLTDDEIVFLRDGSTAWIERKIKNRESKTQP
jgi:hypothetical protein